VGIKKPELPDFVEIFNQQGQQGWLVIQILPPELAQGIWTAKTGNMVALLQRELVQYTQVTSKCGIQWALKTL
jgi:hypothetical protein